MADGHDEGLSMDQVVTRMHRIFDQDGPDAHRTGVY